MKRREKKEAEKDDALSEDEAENKKIKIRAEERATLKHASTGSNWSQGNKRVRYKDQEMLESINQQAKLREKLKERTQFDTDELEENLEANTEKLEEAKPKTSTEILGELGLDNSWLDSKSQDENVISNLKEAIEMDGKQVVEGSGMMNLPEIKQSEEVKQDDENKSESEMEKELRECLEGRISSSNSMIHIVSIIQLKNHD